MRKTSVLVAAGWCFVLLSPRPGSPQARIDSVSPDGEAFEVERLGSFESERAVVEMELLPGDVVTCDRDDALMGLNCPLGSNNVYLLPGPFRVMIDVPGETGCRVNLLVGRVEVLAEEPTEITSGGVEMGSVSTQYAVVASRGASGPLQEVVVFDGEVRVLSRVGTSLVDAGSSLAFDATAGRLEEVPTAGEEVTMSARVYARYDLVKGGVGPEDSAPALARLQRLHYEVLQNPSDTVRRVDLAKAQIEYEANNQALYNLKRADVVTPDALQRYRIDPTVLERSLTPANRDYFRRVVVPGSTVSRTSSTTTRSTRSATDADLERIAKGDAKTALESLLDREKRGQTGSRDYFALAKACLELKDLKRAGAYAERAQKQNEVGAQLSDGELRELKEILARTRR